jgi:transglutaminase-like putative cysteine protease
MGGNLSARWLRLAIGRIVIGLACAAAAAPSSSAPLIPDQSTVVLLAGVPGDSESENAYREQVQSWLDLIEAGGQAQRVFVLCDNPSTVKLPARTPAKALKGNRESFLGLAGTFEGTTNPLVVIAWGHGGQQRSTPVFHVRGPRLTPPDFSAFANRVKPPESHWVLLFRSSGAFAKQLAGPGRQILSSEGETAFTSDPIGMPLLLKLARNSLPFEQLAQEFGRATSQWYEERNLARTEEPTIWAADAKPRALAPAAAAEETLASANVDLAKPPSTNQPSGPTATAQPADQSLPDYWKSIQRVQPREYPEADAVILSQHFTCTLGADPAVTTEQEEFIQILAPEGKQFGDFDISYSPPDEDITFLDCEVLKPDGKLARLDPDAIGEAGERSVGDYQVGKRKFFSLPGVVPGAVLHVRYRTTWKTFPLPHVSMEIPMEKELPARETTVQVSVPKASAFHFAFAGLTAPEPEIQQSSYSTSYTWKFSQLDASSREVLTPPHQIPRLSFSTFPDWTAFAEWYGRISQLTDEVTPELADKAKELTRDARSDREKVVALYNYVTRLRYVAIPLGVNSLRPHAAANVLQNQFGDCKDKANLFNALLHALKLEANLVLVPRFSQAREEIPGLAFNHAISRVMLEGKPLWVDTTDDVCRFGLLPPGDPGRKVLVIDGQSRTLTQLPAPDARDHTLRLEGKIACREFVEAWPVALDATARGYPDYELRTLAREAKAEHVSMPLLAGGFRPAAGSFALEKQTATPLSSLTEDFAWHGEGTCVGLVSSSAGRAIVHSPFWFPREWDQALHRRKAPLFLNQGYPLTLEEEFQIALPPKAQPADLPGICQNSQEPLRWRIEWARLSDDKLVARFHAELARGELSAAETPLLQQQLRALLAGLGAEAIIAVSK